MTDIICVARKHPDQQIRCAVCRLAWDIDDPSPPPCGKLPKVAAPPIAPSTGRLPFASGLPFVDSRQRK